jgi:hypothetical protein
LRYQYRVLPWGPRTVELNHGRFAFRLPPRWELTGHSRNEYRFADRTLPSGLIVSVAYRPRPASLEESRHLLATAPGEAAFREVAPGRFHRALAVSRTYGGDTFDFTRHQLVVQDSRAIWYLVADWLRVPELRYAPNTAADNDFFRAQIPQVRVRMKSNSEEKDEWSQSTTCRCSTSVMASTPRSICSLTNWRCSSNSAWSRQAAQPVDGSPILKR